jgi:hypothetical protein
MEKSPSYAMYYCKAAGRIKAALPSVKMITLLRDPVERTYSSFYHHCRKNRLKVCMMREGCMLVTPPQTFPVESSSASRSHRPRVRGLVPKTFKSPIKQSFAVSSDAKVTNRRAGATENGPWMMNNAQTVAACV